MPQDSVKLYQPCPECEENGLRLVIDDDEGEVHVLCVKCKEVDRLVEPLVLMEIISGISKRADEEGEEGVTRRWIAGFIEHKLDI
jgi:hypothetical protein